MAAFHLLICQNVGVDGGSAALVLLEPFFQTLFGLLGLANLLGFFLPCELLFRELDGRLLRSLVRKTPDKDVERVDVFIGEVRVRFLRRPFQETQQAFCRFAGDGVVALAGFYYVICQPAFGIER